MQIMLGLNPLLLLSTGKWACGCRRRESQTPFIQSGRRHHHDDHLIHRTPSASSARSSSRRKYPARPIFHISSMPMPCNTMQCPRELPRTNTVIQSNSLCIVKGTLGKVQSVFFNCAISGQSDVDPQTILRYLCARERS